MSTSQNPMIPSFRVGMGYDVHKLVEGRDLYLGGIKIEHSLGLLGHSDADVLIHAICDALLGAANMRDIGYHFPDTSADTLDMDSKVILRKTIELIATRGYRVGTSMQRSVQSVRRLIHTSLLCANVWQKSLAVMRMLCPSRLLLPSDGLRWS